LLVQFKINDSLYILKEYDEVAGYSTINDTTVPRDKIPVFHRIRCQGKEAQRGDSVE
jgi:hypothetical protein